MSLDEIRAIPPHERRVLARHGLLLPHHRLSAVQQKVLALVAEGKGNGEIAAEVKLSVGTVKVYLSRDIYRALSVTNRVQAARYWWMKVEAA